MSYEKDEKTIGSKISVLRTLVDAMIWFAMLLMAVSLFYIGPRLEAALFPVIPSFVVERIENLEDGNTRISGVLYKAFGREHCYPESITAYATGGDADTRIVGIVIRAEPEHRALLNSNMPAGAQEFGPWTMVRPQTSFGPLIIIQITHRCHFLWSTTTRIYEGLSSEVFP